MLDNRELAIVIWTTLFFLGVLLSKKARPHLANLCRMALNLKIIVPFALYGLSMVGVVLIAERLDLWSIDMLGSTILWTVVTGAGLILKLNDVLIGKPVFGSELFSLVSFVAILSFFMSASVLSLAWELIIVLVVTVASILRVVAEKMGNAKPVVQVMDAILTGFTIWLLWFSISEIVTQGGEFNWSALAIDFLMPLVFTGATLTYLFLLSCYAAYESLISRLKAMSGGKTFKKPAILGFALIIGPRPAVVSGVWGAGRFELQNASTLQEGMHAAQTYLRERHEKRAKERSRIAALRTNAGVAGADESGRQLDRREFDETKKALSWLATCQMGWYRNREGTYDPDLLVRNDGLFDKYELPSDHGVSMAVSSDGQSWYGYRRVVSGWVFAVGSNSGPPNQWFYDGAEIPPGFPGITDGWQQWISRSPNWQEE